MGASEKEILISAVKLFRQRSSKRRWNATVVIFIIVGTKVIAILDTLLINGLISLLLRVRYITCTNGRLPLHPDKFRVGGFYAIYS